MMGSGLPIRVLGAEYRYVNFRTRFPFSYGIATLTETQHLMLRINLLINGAPICGYAADNLAPKWFIKEADLSLAAEQAELKNTLDQALEAVLGEKRSLSLFQHWQQLYEAQAAWAKRENKAPLLANFGVSLVERCLWDGLGRALGLTAHDLLLADHFSGLDLGQLRPELKLMAPSSLLAITPSPRVQIRHCIGLADALEAGEAAQSDPLNPQDGFPFSLEENITHYGLTHFKIKLSGQFERDSDRLARILPLLPDQRWFSVDANENFASLASFREQWEAHLGSAYGPDLERGLLWVEQPLHRDASMTEVTAQGIAAWKTAPLLIVDEADATLESLPQALASGYRGTSHKNCKGIIKTLANAGSLRHWAVAHAGSVVLSSEDLTNLPPIALQQDCAVLAALGVSHSERNGHHYVLGMDWLPTEIAARTAAAYPRLLHGPGQHHALRIQHGGLDLAEINASMGLGLGAEVQFD